jgi:hypothetical protein
MVRLYKELFGRGPTKTRTSYAGPDTLEDSLTAAERNMLALDAPARAGDPDVLPARQQRRVHGGRWRRSRVAGCGPS